MGVIIMIIRKAIITGANRGIGKSFALRFAKEGYDLLLIARDKKLLNDCSQQIMDEFHINVSVIPADLSKYEDVKTIVSQISEDPSVEVLINNAGFAVPSFFAESDIEKQLDMVRVHNEAVLMLTRAVLPIMKKNKKGIIVNVASTLAYIPFVANSVYCASKAFLNIFSDVLQREVKGFGIVVQSLNPGRTKTDFHNREAFKNVEKLNTNVKEMSPEEIVDVSFRELGKKLIVIPGFNNRLMLLFKNIIADIFMKKK